MSMTKRVPAVTVLAGLVLAATATGAAAEGPGDVTLWEDYSYTGSKYIDYAQGSSDADEVEIHWWDGDNEISSVKNMTGKWLVLYADDGQRGKKVCLRPGAMVANLGWYGFNDQAESLALRDTNPCA
ncbi:hypothetical protein D5H78_13890 [Vallicoccus soli]|uniref:Uncharacterized protein n=2 Tax=Vallicoccus soli TaxID=2339232 RepID=A0A3A3Z0A2_9ACTN|nr:hypothetical protein D5H78_13890 [Vallicoccus soli]